MPKKIFQNADNNVITIQKGDDYAIISTINNHCKYSFYCVNDQFDYKLASDIFEGKNNSWQLCDLKKSCCSREINMIVNYLTRSVMVEHNIVLNITANDEIEDLINSLNIRITGGKTYLDLYADMGTMYTTIINKNIDLIEKLITEIKDGTNKDFTIVHHNREGYPYLLDTYILRINYAVDGLKLSISFTFSHASSICVIL